MIELSYQLVQAFILAAFKVAVSKFVIGFVILYSLFKLGIGKHAVVNKGLTEKKILRRLLGKQLVYLFFGDVSQFNSKVAETLVNALLSYINVLDLICGHKSRIYSQHAKSHSCMLFILKSLSQIFRSDQLFME